MIQPKLSHFRFSEMQGKAMELEKSGASGSYD